MVTGSNYGLESKEIHCNVHVIEMSDSMVKCILLELPRRQKFLPPLPNVSHTITGCHHQQDCKYTDPGETDPRPWKTGQHKKDS